MNPWLLAIRPKTLPASVSPIILSNVYCYTAFAERFQWPVLVLTLLAALFIQIAVNLANDYFDFKKGVDTELRVGPKRVSQSGLIQPRTVFFVIAVEYRPGRCLCGLPDGDRRAADYPVNHRLGDLCHLVQRRAFSPGFPWPG